MNKEKEQSLVDFSKVQLKKIFSKAGLNSSDTEKAILDYMRYRESELATVIGLSYEELISSEEALTEEVFKLKNGVELVDDILRSYIGYLSYKKEIIKTYQESKSWDKVITTVVYSNIEESQEAFIDYVIETYQTQIKDAKHLKELTNIKEETIEGLEETLINSNFSKYFRALEKAISQRATYKDLLKIEPKDYNLNKQWKGALANDKDSSILRAINISFLLGEPANLMLLPNLRLIAEELKAPYSVLINAYNLTRR